MTPEEKLTIKTDEIEKVLFDLYSEKDLINLEVTTGVLMEIQKVLKEQRPDEDWLLSEIRPVVKVMVEWQRECKLYEFETRLSQLANSYDFVTSSIGSLEEPDEEIDDPIRNNTLDILTVLNNELNSIITEFSQFNTGPHN